MPSLSSKTLLHSRSSSVGVGRGSGTQKARTAGVVLAPGYVKCLVCGMPKKREQLDALLRCETCEASRCRRCRRPLQADGACLGCLEVQVAHDEHDDELRRKETMDDLGNVVRPSILTEDDEYNAYSAGVYEFNVNDDTIATIRDEDSLNEWRREMRGQYITQGGLCPFCFIEMAEVEARRGAHDDCLEALDDR